MSDSDDDLLQNNIFTYNNENTTISARGPIVNNISINELSLHNNVLTSTQRYLGSNIYQRSTRYGREMSPMSLRSARDHRPCNFNRASFRRGMGLQRSLYSARSGSPATVHSINSTASLRAADIIFAFKNEQFDKHDLKAIKEAFAKLMKTSHRKRIEKRRNHRLLRIRNHRHSGEDSGEQGSDSSISSDDCRSIKTTTCHENMRDIAHFSTNIRENHMFRDCSESLKQTSIRNLCSISNSISNRLEKPTRERIQNTTAIDQSQSPIEVQSTSIITNKERFKKGFLLPSQRFNKTIGRIQVSAKDKIITNGKIKKVNGATGTVGSQSDSESEEIFGGFPKNPHQELKQKKRALENDGNLNSSNKRSKVDSSGRLQNTEYLDSSLETRTKNTLDDFIFAKPKMPIKKVHTKIDLGPEKLLARSKVPVITEEEDFDITQDSNIKYNDAANGEVTINAKQPDTLQSTNDVSMRPSFIKRKLFTQKLDVAEKRNLSCDSIPANSPQNVYSISMREKNKARKLIASQSCLSREVPTEDSNILDLIHKIVPANQINVTNVANKTELCSKSNNANNSGKWDVTLAISNCNNQDLSDTYTDEEIFNATYNKNIITNAKSQKSTKNAKEDAKCKVVVEQLNSKILENFLKDNNNRKVPQLMSTYKETNKKSVTDCVKLFWDTDFESDVELNKASHLSKRTTQTYQEPPRSVHKEQNKPEDKPNNSNKVAPIPKGTILTVRNCHREPKLNFSVKSKKNHVVDDKSVTGNTQPNSLVQGNLDNSKLGTSVSKVSNKKLYADKKNNGKENVSVTEKQRLGGKTKAKRGVDDLVINNNIDKSKRPNSNVKLRDKDSKESTKTSNKKMQHSENSTQEQKQSKGKNSNKTDKSIRNNDINILKQMTNVKKQPKRKAKENMSYILSPQPNARSNNIKATNARSKTTKQLASKNTSLNSINTRSSCSSRQKLSFNCSACDHSSVNISNISSRSLRLRQRKINELYKSRL